MEAEPGAGDSRSLATPPPSPCRRARFRRPGRHRSTGGRADQPGRPVCWDGSPASSPTRCPRAVSSARSTRTRSRQRTPVDFVISKGSSPSRCRSGWADYDPRSGSWPAWASDLPRRRLRRRSRQGRLQTPGRRGRAEDGDLIMLKTWKGAASDSEDRAIPRTKEDRDRTTRTRMTATADLLDGSRRAGATAPSQAVAARSASSARMRAAVCACSSDTSRWVTRRHSPSFIARIRTPRWAAACA